MSFNWIVTKSQPHADSLAIQLRRLGFAARAIPCIEHHWSDWPELRQVGARGPSLLFVTSRAVAARVEVPADTTVAAISPTTSATLEARGIRVHVSAHGGVRELAAEVVRSAQVATGTEVFYPTSEAAQRQPEHLAAVAELASRFRVHAQAVYRTVIPVSLQNELAALGTPGAPAAPGFIFWSPSAIENFGSARGFERPPAPVVLVGGSTMRAWGEIAPPEWRRAYKHDAETPLEWSLRFLERDPGASRAS